MPVDKGHLKRVFPGGNTPKGFFSYYDQIIGPEARRIIIIKGGPGVGKSSFMKAIGQTMLERGYDLEYHHCSSDNNSLDGIVIPEIGVAFIDGTAPHVVDPKNPGCVDEILHLGDYWREDGMLAGKKQILELNQNVGRLFRRAYRYLAAARSVYDEWEACNGYAFDPGLANLQAETLRRSILGDRPVAIRPGRIRRLFASAITPEGPKNYLETILDQAHRIWAVSGEPGTGKATLLAKLVHYASEQGIMSECYCCPFDPEKIEHVFWPELRLGVTTTSWPHIYSGDSDEIMEVDMNGTLDHGIRDRFADAVESARQNFRTLFDQAVSAIAEAKQAHDEMEQYYVPHMDFAAIDTLRNQVLERVLAYAGERERVGVM